MAIPHGARETINRAAAELATVAPFSELSPVDRARLAAALDQVTYQPGDTIFRQGERADALYILREGEVERLADGTRLEVLDPPAVFGDLALLRDEPRATTLRAVTECLVWRLPGDRFTRVLRRTPGIATFFAATVSSRLADSLQRIAELSQEFEGMAEHLYSNLSSTDQLVLERAALLPELDTRVIGRLSNRALPLADVLLDGHASRPAYPPVFRRFLLGRMTDRVGPNGVA